MDNRQQDIIQDGGEKVPIAQEFEVPERAKKGRGGNESRGDVSEGKIREVT